MRRIFYLGYVVGILFFMLDNIQAQIKINGNLYVDNTGTIHIGQDQTIILDTLFIGNINNPNLSSPTFMYDNNSAIFLRGGLIVNGFPNPANINAAPLSGIYLINVYGNNKTFAINIAPIAQDSVIKNLYFVSDLSNNVDHVNLYSAENTIHVKNNFYFDPAGGRVVLKPSSNNHPLDLYVGGNMNNGNQKTYIVTSNKQTTLSRDVNNGAQTFFVGGGINTDSFFSPVKIVAKNGSGTVSVASLKTETLNDMEQILGSSVAADTINNNDIRNEYVNNLWYINASKSTITNATVGLQHNSVLEVAPYSTITGYYYYPDDTANIVRYVGTQNNIIGGDTSYTKWETLKYEDFRNNTTIASQKYGNPNNMIWSNDNPTGFYMERQNIANFNDPQYVYYSKIRYADDKGPFGKRFVTPEYLKVSLLITGPSEAELMFEVRNEYRIYEYQIFKGLTDDPNDPSFTPIAKTIEASAKTNFDDGKFVHTYTFKDNEFSINGDALNHYMLVPIGGTGRDVEMSPIKKPDFSIDKKLIILGNPISRQQGEIRYRFTSINNPYQIVNISLVASNGQVVALQTISAEQSQLFYGNIPISSIAAGAYIVVAQGRRLDGKIDIYTARVIVE